VELFNSAAFILFDQQRVAVASRRSKLASVFLRILLTCLATLFTTSSYAQVCLASDATAIRNTYYVGASNPSATTVTLGAIRVDPNANAIALGAGDLAFIIQMQDATVNTTNGIAYGNGTTGTGSTSQVNSGLYEFRRVASVAGGLVTFTTALANIYSNAAATPTLGQKRFQVLRLPEFASLALATGSFAPPVWNGGTGGVFVLNVAGALSLTNYTINASGAGFRGGGAVETSVNSGNLVVDYATSVGTGAPPNNGAVKGEGIAGTPRYVRNAAVTPYSNSDLTSSGYPNNLDFSRGAPANAGGGGTQHNAGGGGGANGGAGGFGGGSFSIYSATNTGSCVLIPFFAPGTVNYFGCGGDGARQVGGLGGTAVNTAAATKLFLGGGGGAGDANNSSDNATIAQNAGGNGGGAVFVRAVSISATNSSIIANGQAGLPGGRDAAGGGGAGGSIYVSTTTASSLTGLLLTANGGNGADTGYTLFGNEVQGPGGGGGGGIIARATLTTGGALAQAFGTAGTNSPTANAISRFGATDGASGSTATLPTSTPPPCPAPALTLTKTASSSAFVVGTPASYTLSVQNTGSAVTSATASVTDSIPTGLTIGTLPAGCTAAGQVVTCTIAAGLAVNATTSFVIPVTPTSTAATPVVNTASVSGGGDPVCPSATTARCNSTTNTPLNAPALTLTKTASSSAFVVGTPASYTLTVTNTGTTATTAASTVTDSIPTGLTIGTLPAGCTAAGQVVTCTVPTNQATGAAAAVSFVIPVTPTASAATPVVNSASVRGGGDPGCTATTTPLPGRCNPTTSTPLNAPDMTSAITGLPLAAAPGATVNGTLTCTNGSTTAAATSVTCSVVGATLGNCQINGVNVTQPASVPAGGSLVCAISAIAASTGNIALTGTTSASNEINTANNGSTGNVPVVDAVNDAVVTITSTTSAQAVPGSVLSSDTIGGIAATTSNVTVQSTITVTGGPTTSGWAIDAAGIVTAPASVAPGSYSINYQICSNPAATPVACDTAAKLVTVNAGTPADLTPTFTFSFTAYVVNDIRDVVININEINNVASTGLARFFVPFSSGFTYAFDPARTTATLFAPNDTPGMQNGNWTVTTQATGFLFASTTPIPAGGRSRIVITSRADVAGTKANITVNIVALSGGEVRTNNNAVVLAQSVQR